MEHHLRVTGNCDSMTCGVVIAIVIETAQSSRLFCVHCCFPSLGPSHMAFSLQGHIIVTPPIMRLSSYHQKVVSVNRS